MELSETLIKKLKTDSNFNAFLVYVTSKINELNTVDGLREMSYEMAGQEAMVRRIAVDRLYDIIKPVITYQERNKITDEALAKKMAQYGI